MGSRPPGDKLRPFILICCAAAGGLALLFVAHLFYLQFLLAVFGGAVMAGITVWDRRSVDFGNSSISPGDADRLIALQETLVTIDDRLSRPTGAEEEQFLRARKTAVEQDLRKLKWSIRESGLESLRGAGGQEGLRPLPTKQSPRQLRRADRAERDHILRSLGEAEEVLASEPLGSAGARLALIAADVRAHYRLLKGLETTSRNLGDYAIAWAVLASISRGAGFDRRVSSHASTRIRGRLEGLCGTAIARGLVGARADGSEGGQGMAERWK